jgi:CO/xanthine dehydrogenase Mo-binding subunit
MAQIKIHRDGTVETLCGTQDIGGGARTVVLVLTSREFGFLPFEKIRVRIGDSDFGSSGASAGSSTTGGVTREVQAAARSVRQAFFTELAEKVKANAGDLEIREGGRVGLRGGNKSWSWEEACEMLRDTVIGSAPTIVDPGWEFAIIHEDGKIEQASERTHLS